MLIHVYKYSFTGILNGKLKKRTSNMEITLKYWIKNYGISYGKYGNYMLYIYIYIYMGSTEKYVSMDIRNEECVIITLKRTCYGLTKTFLYEITPKIT